MTKPEYPEECETCKVTIDTPGFNCNCCWIKAKRDAYFDSPEIQQEIESIVYDADHHEDEVSCLW